MPRGSPRPIVGDANDLAPFLDFFGDKFAKVVGRTAKFGATKLSKLLFRLGIGEYCVHLFVELSDDRRRRFLRRPDPLPGADF
jgi:hypothetical protein